jgi:hypothetical protein
MPQNGPQRQRVAVADPATPLPRLRVEYWPIERLKPYERNPRKNDKAVDQIRASFREFGFAVPILAKSDGRRAGKLSLFVRQARSRTTVGDSGSHKQLDRTDENGDDPRGIPISARKALGALGRRFGAGLKHF